MKKISTISFSLLLTFIAWLLLLPVFAAAPVNLTGDFSLSITVISGEEVNGDPIVSSYVMGTKYDYGVPVNVNFETLANEGEEFVYFVNNGQVSTSSTANFIVTSDTKIIAFLKPIGQILAIFVDSNGDVIDGDYMSESGTPNIPSLLPNKPGYQVNATTPWTPAVSSISTDTVYYINYELVNSESTVDVTVDGDTTVYPYNSIVTLDASLDENFTHWEENGVIVSYNPIYKFSAINDRNITKETNGGVSAPVLYLQEVAIRENYTSYLAQINLPAGYEVLEYGFVGSNTHIDGQYEPEISDPDVTIMKSNVKHSTTNEFLRSMDDSAGFVYTRAYAIIKQDSTISVIYSLVRNDITLGFTFIQDWDGFPTDGENGVYITGFFNNWSLDNKTDKNGVNFTTQIKFQFIGSVEKVLYKIRHITPEGWADPEWFGGTYKDPDYWYNNYGILVDNPETEPVEWENYLEFWILPSNGPVQNADPYLGY